MGKNLQKVVEIKKADVEIPKRNKSVISGDDEWWFDKITEQSDFLI